MRDRYGQLAEDRLREALAERIAPSDEISRDTLVFTLVGEHLSRLEADGRSSATLDTYRFAAGKLELFLGGVRVREATAGRVDAALRAMSAAHGPTMARQSKTILRGALGLAVRAGALPTNPVTDAGPIRSTAPAQGAPAPTGDQLAALLRTIADSARCREADLADPITMLIATGLRRSELLALRWADVDENAGTVTVSGKVVRAKGVGLVRIDRTKSAAGLRTLPLPMFALSMLHSRAAGPHVGPGELIFPSTNGGLRDPNNFGKQWRLVRADLGVPDVTSHSFRRALATLMDEKGLSPRQAADQLGHSKVSMTTDVYFTRGRTHSEVAAALDSLVIFDE